MLRLRLLSAALAAVLLGVAAPGPQPQNADREFNALAHDYWYSGFALDPVSATQAGVHAYDAQLGDYSAKAFEASIRRDRMYLAQLGSIHPAQLSPEVRIDERLLENALDDDLLQKETQQTWRHNPDLYAQVASGAIFTLMARNYAPEATRLRYVIARETAIPAMLEQAKKNITSVDAVTAEIAADDAAGGQSFLTGSVPQTFAGVHDATLQRELVRSNAAAARALGAYAAWIKHLKTSGTFAIGTAAYERRLRDEDGLNMPVGAYLAIGERALAQTRTEFIATAKRIDPSKKPLEVYLSITKDHPPANGLMAKASSDLVKLRAFIEAKHIVTLPADSNIKVVETPPFMRATTEAAEDSPGPLETVATQAYYFITPPDPSWNAKQREEYLAVFNNYEFPVGYSAHEVYPGHFTNFAIDRHLHLSLTRELTSTSEFAEGWAHYDEQMVVDEGWGNGDPRVRLGQLEEALLRECRYVAGVKLHTQGMTIAQSEKLFSDTCFQPPQVGIGETLRGTQDPMYGYYTLGKLMILKLRADYKKKLGPAFTLEKFHDAFLAHGDPPIPYIRPLLLGAQDDGKPL